MDFSHIQLVEYSVQIGGHITEKIAMFNCNKLPTGVATRCIETDTYNPYLLTMSKEQFIALFMDDVEIPEQAAQPEPTAPSQTEDDPESEEVNEN